MHPVLRKTLRAIFNHDPSFTDMYEDAHARRIADEYLRHLTSALARLGPPPLTILDGGCQAGRILIPLAQQGHRLIGVDTSGFSLRRALGHAKRLNLRIQTRRGTIAKLEQWIAHGSLDALICTEVLYLCPDFRQILRQFLTLVRPGGLVCASHRAAPYYLAKTVEHGRPELLQDLATRSEGPSTDGDYHNWQGPAQLQELYQALGFQVHACHPIDATVTQFPTEMPPAAHAVLEPTRDREGRFHIPTYYLVIAQRP